MSRNPDRCPSYPGEVLREDIIPATGKVRPFSCPRYNNPGATSRSSIGLWQNGT